MNAIGWKFKYYRDIVGILVLLMVSLATLGLSIMVFRTKREKVVKKWNASLITNVCITLGAMSILLFSTLILSKKFVIGNSNCAVFVQNLSLVFFAFYLGFSVFAWLNTSLTWIQIETENNKRMSRHSFIRQSRGAALSGAIFFSLITPPLFMPNYTWIAVQSLLCILVVAITFYKGSSMVAKQLEEKRIATFRCLGGKQVQVSPFQLLSLSGARQLDEGGTHNNEVQETNSRPSLRYKRDIRVLPSRLRSKIHISRTQVRQSMCSSHELSVIVHSNPQIEVPRRIQAWVPPLSLIPMASRGSIGNLQPISYKDSNARRILSCSRSIIAQCSIICAALVYYSFKGIDKSRANQIADSSTSAFCACICYLNMNIIILRYLAGRTWPIRSLNPVLICCKVNNASAGSIGKIESEKIYIMNRISLKNKSNIGS